VGRCGDLRLKRVPRYDLQAPRVPLDTPRVDAVILVNGFIQDSTLYTFELSQDAHLVGTPQMIRDLSL
jgi:hypothetical protein